MNCLRITRLYRHNFPVDEQHQQRLKQENKHYLTIYFAFFRLLKTINGPELGKTRPNLRPLETADGEVLVIIGGLIGSVDSATTEVIDFGGGSCDGASLPDLTFDTYSSLAMTDGDGFPQTCGGYSELV